MMCFRNIFTQKLQFMDSMIPSSLLPIYILIQYFAYRHARVFRHTFQQKFFLETCLKGQSHEKWLRLWHFDVSFDLNYSKVRQQFLKF
jgi:hypothetical protein